MVEEPPESWAAAALGVDAVSFVIILQTLTELLYVSLFIFERINV